MALLLIRRRGTVRPYDTGKPSWPPNSLRTPRSKASYTHAATASRPQPVRTVSPNTAHRPIKHSPKRPAKLRYPRGKVSPAPNSITGDDIVDLGFWRTSGRPRGRSGTLIYSFRVTRANPVGVRAGKGTNPPHFAAVRYCDLGVLVLWRCCRSMGGRRECRA